MCYFPKTILPHEIFQNGMLRGWFMYWRRNIPYVIYRTMLIIREQTSCLIQGVGIRNHVGYGITFMSWNHWYGLKNQINSLKLLVVAINQVVNRNRF